MSLTATEYKRKSQQRAPWKLDNVRPLTNDAQLFLHCNGKNWSNPEKVIARFGLQSACLMGTGRSRGEEVIVWPIREGLWKVYRYRHKNKDKRWGVVPSGQGADLFGDLESASYILCEGEWDVFAAYDLGLGGAICGTAGAGTWLPEWTERFRGKPVTLIYDVDPKGRAGARKVCDELHGVASEVRNIVLPLDAKQFPHGDLSDFIALNGDGSRRHTLEEVKRLILATPPFDPTKAAYPSVSPPTGDVTIAEVRTALDTHFPGLWPAAEVCLSVPHTLLLADNANPVGVNLVDVPASEKSTLLDLFAVDGIVYRCDGFSPKAFVTHTASAKRGDLDEIDLLPRIRYRVIVVPELAPIFGARQEDLLQNVSILTRIFDGRGLITDSGVHGRRGYEGDYLFGWLGATTPIDHRVWNVLGKLGSRWLFLAMPPRARDEEKLKQDLVGPVPYRERVQRCADVVSEFLRGQWVRLGGVRGVVWDRGADPSDVLEWIIRLGQVVCRLRGLVSVWREGHGDGEYNYTLPMVEEPARVNALLYALARGHALAFGRTQLSRDDLPSVASVALSSGPDDRRRVLREIIRHKGTVTSTQIEEALRTSRPTARAILTTLAVLGIGELTASAGPLPLSLCLAEELQWLLDREHQAVLGIEVEPF